MKRTTLTLTFLAPVLMAAGVLPAASADISRSYSYFSIGGKTLGEIEEQLRSRGPEVQSTGQRHPGATRMEFKTKITYEEDERRCRIAAVNVSVDAQVFLPRWRKTSSGTKKAILALPSAMPARSRKMWRGSGHALPARRFRNAPKKSPRKR